MSKPYQTSKLPTGTVIEYEGTRVKKTHPPAHEPFPWTSENGTEFGDEWAARAIADGALVVEE